MYIQMSYFCICKHVYKYVYNMYIYVYIYACFVFIFPGVLGSWEKTKPLYFFEDEVAEGSCFFEDNKLG